MAWTLFGSRSAPADSMQKRTKVGPRATGLDTGYDVARAKGMGIEPGAKPMTSAPWGNPVQQIGSALKSAGHFIFDYNPYAKKKGK